MFEEADVDDARLPNIRVIAVPIAPAVILGTIGLQLRTHYAELLNQPVPERLDEIAQQLVGSRINHATTRKSETLI
jgi:Anti-sigma factor NepR